MSMIFLNLIINSFSLESQAERVYIFKIISFNKKYEVFCTKTANGYYKYPQNINNQKVYLTYEGNEFFEQCKFDENLTVFNELYASNMWSNNRGDMLMMKKRYSPVIEKNRKRKNYPYGFGKN